MSHHVISYVIITYTKPTLKQSVFTIKHCKTFKKITKKQNNICLHQNPSGCFLCIPTKTNLSQLQPSQPSATPFQPGPLKKNPDGAPLGAVGAGALSKKPLWIWRQFLKRVKLKKTNKSQNIRQVTLPKFNIAPEKWMVGKLLSFWDGVFSGAMLNFRWVNSTQRGCINQVNWRGFLELTTFGFSCLLFHTPQQKWKGGISKAGLEPRFTPRLFFTWRFS